MFGDRNNVLCAGADEEINPRIGIEVLRAKQGDEVFITKRTLRPVGGDVMLEGRAARLIHVAGIPFVAECWDRIDSPVEKDSELGIAEPIGCLVTRERLPIGVKRTMSVCCPNLGYLLFYLWRIGCVNCWAEQGDRRSSAANETRAARVDLILTGTLLAY